VNYEVRSALRGDLPASCKCECPEEVSYGGRAMKTFSCY